VCILLLEIIVSYALVTSDRSAGSTSLLASFPTESAPILTLHFSKYNYLIAAGSGP